MSNTYPGPSKMAARPEEQELAMDEPDFSGLMALTEASIRRKLSELKYTDPDLPDSQSEEDSVFNVVSDNPNQPVKTVLTDIQTSHKVTQNSSHKNLLKDNGSDTFVYKPLNPASVSMSEQSESDKEKYNSHVDVTSNIMRFESALDDPELVKMVSLGLKSSKTSSDLDPRVKYCGLNVDLRTENKSPGFRKSPENVKFCGVNMEFSAEKKTPPKPSPEYVNKGESNKEILSKPVSPPSVQSSGSLKYSGFPIETYVEKKSPASKLSPESIKYCGLSMEISSQSKISPSKHFPENLTDDSVVKSINFDSEIAKLDRIKTSSQMNKDPSQTISTTEGGKDSSILHTTEEMPIDTVCKTSRTADQMSELAVSEKQDKSMTDNFVHCQKEPITVTKEVSATPMEFSAQTDAEFQTCSSVARKDIPVAEESIEQVPESDSGLVISNVCSAAEACAEDSSELSQIRETDNEQVQSMTDSQESSSSAQVMAADQHPATEPTSPSRLDQLVKSIAAPDDAVSKTTHDSSEELPKHVDIDATNTESSLLNKDNLSNDQFKGNIVESDSDKIKMTAVTDSAELVSEIQPKTAEGLLNTNKVVNESVKSDSATVLFDSSSNKAEVQTVGQNNQSEEEKISTGLSIPLQSVNSFSSSEAVSDSSEDSVEIIPILTPPVNKNLSALESMLMRVTENHEKLSSEKESNEPVTLMSNIKASDSGCNSSSDNLLACLNNRKEKEILIEKNKNETQCCILGEEKDNIGPNDTSIQKPSSNLKEDQNKDTPELTTSKDDKFSKNDARITVDESKETEAEGRSAISLSPVCKAVENADSGLAPVTESSSLSAVSDMLMITNVRSISLDEVEEFNSEENKVEDSSTVSPQIIAVEETRPSAPVDSLGEDENSSGIKITEVHSERSEPVSLASEVNSTASLNQHSESNVEDTRTSQPANVNMPGKESLSHRDVHSVIDRTNLSKTYPGTSNVFSPPVCSPPRESGSSSVTSVSSSMPVIANTFTVKEEPMDYEPYGIPSAIANSRSRQSGNIQPSGYQISGEPFDMPGTANSWRPLKQFVNIQNKKDQEVNGKVTSVSMNNVPMSNAAYSSNYPRSANGILRRQKSPLTVVLPASFQNGVEKQAAKSTNVLGNTLVRKIAAAKPVTVEGKTPKVPVAKRHASGLPVQLAHSQPPVVKVPIKHTATPNTKLAMNLKTINIETVGIPMITEMIARKNPIPVYKPPPPPKCVLGDEKSRKTFPCYECGDTFYFTSSLEQHVNRCSMKISYKCEWCKKILNFTNKCQLLSHLRSHMNIDKHQAVPIHIKSDSIEIRTNYDDIVPGKEFKWYKIPEKENVSGPIQETQFLVNMSSNSQPQQVRLCKLTECTECNLTFYKKDENAKRLHFAADKSLKALFCDTCPIYLHNKCGIKAHQRLHEDFMSGEYLVCPECGLCYDKQMLPTFLQHIRTKCFHLSRFSSIKCDKCNVNCSSVHELKHHLTISVEQYYKCNRCPMALKTVKSFQSHFNQTHKDKDGEKEENNKASAKIIYRCHVCDTLIDDKEFLLSHVEKHLLQIKSKAQDFFHCLQCGLIFFEKKSLVYHYLQAHKVIKQESFCTLCRTMKKDQVEFTRHILENHVAPPFKKKAEICDQCGLVCIDYNALRMHECHMKNVAFIVQGDESASQKHKKNKSPRKVAEKKKESPQKDLSTEKKANFRSILPKPASNKDQIPGHLRRHCPHCNYAYMNSKERTDHLRDHWDDSVFICLHCDKKTFKNNNELVNHESACVTENNSDKGDPIPKHLSKKCPSCRFIYGGSSNRISHLRIHRSDKIFICMFCDAMNFNDYAELRSHEVLCGALSKKTVKSPEKSQSTTIKLKFSKGKATGQSDKQQKLELYQLEYKCDDCGQLFSRKEKQEEHTRLEHGIHPCHLCGLMYESQTSLKKHLLISHEGKKCVYYCWVCRRRKKFFSDVAHLQKHFTMKHKQKVWDPSKAVPALPGFGTHDGKTTQPEKRRIEASPEKSDTPVKKLRIAGDKGFKCAKCDFMCEERKEFLGHIKEHKTDDSVQCIECGLCFMVMPSLKKHLFMVHKVRDFDTYFKEHSIEDIQEPEESDSENEATEAIEREEMGNVDESESGEEEAGNPLECKVCYKTFDTDHSMKRHMRVHGMAFIKKTRRSLGSTAKKPKLDIDEMAKTNDKTEGKTEETNSEIEKESSDVNMIDKEENSQ